MKVKLFVVVLFVIFSFSSSALLGSKILPELFETLEEKHLYIPEPYREFIIEKCREYEVPVKLIYRLITKESQWNPQAVNTNYYNKKVDSYDYGLLQLNSAYVSYYSTKFNEGKEIDVFDPFKSIEIGIKYVKWAFNLTSSWRDAIIVYNAGYTRWKENRVPKSTYLYADEIAPEGEDYVD